MEIEKNHFVIAFDGLGLVLYIEFFALQQNDTEIKFIAEAFPQESEKAKPDKSQTLFNYSFILKNMDWNNTADFKAESPVKQFTKLLQSDFKHPLIRGIKNYYKDGLIRVISNNYDKI